MNNIYIATDMIASAFAKQVEGQPEHVRSWLLHKLKHTFCVASEITNLLFKEQEIFNNFSEEDRELVELSGILHDLGRFYQVADGEILSHHTFNHGKHAVELLKEHPIFNNPILLFAIEEHNKGEIDYNSPFLENISEKDKEKAIIIAKLLRDADKMENIRFFIYNNSNLFKGYRPSGPINDEMKAELIQNKVIEPIYVKTLEDGLLYHLSWVHNIYFKATMSEIKSLGYIKKGLKELKELNVSEEDLKLIEKHLTV